MYFPIRTTALGCIVLVLAEREQSMDLLRFLPTILRSRRRAPPAVDFLRDTLSAFFFFNMLEEATVDLFAKKCVFLREGRSMLYIPA